MAKQLRNALFAAFFGMLFLFVSACFDEQIEEIEPQIALRDTTQPEKDDVQTAVVSKCDGDIVPPKPSSGNSANEYTSARETEELICTQTNYICAETCPKINSRRFLKGTYQDGVTGKPAHLYVKYIKELRKSDDPKDKEYLQEYEFCIKCCDPYNKPKKLMAVMNTTQPEKDDVPTAVVSGETKRNGVIVPPNPSSGNSANDYTGAKETEESICTQTNYTCDETCPKINSRRFLKGTYQDRITGRYVHFYDEYLKQLRKSDDLKDKEFLQEYEFCVKCCDRYNKPKKLMAVRDTTQPEKDDVQTAVVSKCDGDILPPKPSSGNSANEYTSARETEELICTQTNYTCSETCPKINSRRFTKGTYKDRITGMPVHIYAKHIKELRKSDDPKDKEYLQEYEFCVKCCDAYNKPKKLMRV